MHKNKERITARPPASPTRIAISPPSSIKILMNNQTIAAKCSRWPTYAVWLGPLITLAGALSYFLYFVQFPVLRDFPLLNLPIVLLGLILTSAGGWQTFRRQGHRLAKTFATASFLFSIALAGLFGYSIFFLSYQMPEATAVPKLQDAAPNFSLADQNGKHVQLSDYLGSKVLLVFYRGHW